MSFKKNNFIFGPVPSRRLGISLGIDLIPFKTCSLDCVYCECGRTTNFTRIRKPFVSVDTILEDLKPYLNKNNKLDYITFSGSGEPTLNSDIGKIIDRIKEISNTPIAVLTNGTLLDDASVREDLLNSDLVLPSLDAVTPEIFNKINRPAKGVNILNTIEGIIKFRSEYNGKIWLEVFIASGINDSKEELHKIHKTILKINPDKVQLNTLDRPPAYDNIKSITMDKLDQIRDEWKDLPVEIIKRIKKREEILSFSKNLENNILNTIIRRPLTIDDLSELTGKHNLELYKYIDVLAKEKKIREKIINNKIFLIPFEKQIK